MKKISQLLLISILIFNSHTSFSEKNEPVNTKSVPIEELEINENLNDALDALKDYENGINRISRKKKLDCMKAFGHEMFCECIASKTAMSISFVDYVNITSTPKEDIGFENLDKEIKALIDETISTRNMCVGVLK